MAKVKAKVNPGANMGTICEEIIAAAAAAMPGSNPSAEVVRDGNGKVVEVFVNLPDNDAPGLANATAAIDANNGVSKASQFGQFIADDDFTGGTPGAVLVSFVNGPDPYVWDGGVSPTSIIPISAVGVQQGDDGEDIETLVRSAYANESVGGTGSALMLQLQNQPGSTSATYGSGWDLIGTTVANGLDPINRLKYSFNIAFPTTINSVACDTPTLKALTLDFLLNFPGAGAAKLRFPLVGPAGNITVAGVDTGVAAGASHTIELLVNTGTGGMNLLTIDGGSPIVLTGGGAAMMSFGLLLGQEAPSYDVQFAADLERSADQIPPVILDNIKYEILA